MKNILFYKYVSIKDLKKTRQTQLDLCKSLDLKGKVIFAKEGINGCLSGENKNIDKYVKTMHADKKFKDIEFKTGIYNEHTFKRVVVKVKREIISLRLKNDVDMKKHKGKYIEPKELKQRLDKGEKIVLIDARNKYETEVGKFKNAIDPSIEVFSEFPKAMSKLKQLKNKKIVTYCTGGIRCEKASAYLVKQGFKDVYQLHGGIIKYGQECGNDHWNGKCFVFDRRGAIDIDPSRQTKPESQCVICFIPFDEKYNCLHPKCGKEFSACDVCIKLLNNCCSKKCRNDRIKILNKKPRKK